MEDNIYNLNNVLEGYAIESQPATQNNKPIIDMDELLKNIKGQQDIRQEYIDDLQKLYNRTGTYNARDIGANMLTRGLDSFYGIDVFNKPLQNRGWTEANTRKANLLDKISKAKLDNYNLGQDVLGNAYIAQSIGLPPEVALGNANLLKSIAPVLSSMNALKGKTYAADVSLERARLINASKEKIAQMNNNRAMAIAQGTWSTQKEIAFNRDKANLQRAMVTALGFGADPADLFGSTNVMGITNVDTNMLNDLFN